MSAEERQKIHVLPTSLANRIAAGEVVERPASVVKELVENCLDASATKVVVEIEEAGKGRIRVLDDGVGMDREDALRAIERHATSKIHHADDLFAIQTLGFRGEALPSIASVSLFSLTTRGLDSVGTRLTIEGGELKHVEDVGFPRGTEIDIRKLFYNTPARRKFLKRDATELAAISEVMQRIALVRPDVRIEYRHNGRDLMNLPATDDLHERVAGVFGKDAYPKLFPVSGERGGFHLSGMISAPELTRPTPAALHLFVNGRPIRDRSLMHAVTSAYGTMLEPRRFPIAALMLEMPIDLLDVNVHPAKTEVRFADARMVYRILHEGVREALGRSPWLGGVGTPGGGRRETGGDAVGAEIALANYFKSQSGQRHFTIPGGSTYQSPMQVQGSPASMVENQSFAVGPAAAPFGMGFSSFTVLAQLHNTYILVSTPRGLGIIDQHAAHERVAFERLKVSYDTQKIERQILLFPVRVELDAGRLAALEEFVGDVTALGFDVETFGGDSVQIRAVPQLLAGADPASALRDLLDELADAGGSRAVEDRIDLALATLACHSAIRANEALNYEQMEALLRQLDTIDFATHCPHGRPVFIEVSQMELEKRFGRIK